MASRALAIVAALAGVAHAQDAPPVEPAASAPAPVPVAAPEPPPPVREQPEKHAIDTLIVGMGFGIAGATGTPSEIYGPSYGVQIALGIAYGPFSLEGRTGLGYGALPKQEALQGRTTRGSLSQHSIIVRGQLPIGPVAIGGFIGIATGSVPVLTAGTDPDYPVRVHPEDVDGIGATFGGSVHLRVAAGLELSAELALSKMSWGLPDAAYVTNPMSTGDTTTFTPSTADISSTIYAFTVALRGTIEL